MALTDEKPLLKIAFLQALAALLTLLPLLSLNLNAFIGNTDALFYTTILRLTAHHMAMGELLPGWLPEANGGIGSPVLMFYSRLAYEITAILGSPLAHIDPLGWKRLVLGLFAAQWLGGIAAWAWLSRHTSKQTALIASLLFTLFPYKWIYIYLHINLSQLWALVWLPPLMMAAEDMCAGKRSAPVWYGLWLALITLTHPPTLIAFGAVPALYVLVFSHPHWRHTIKPLACAHLLALALSAFYLLPAILNHSLVQAALFTREQWNYATNLSHYDLILNFHYAVIATLVIGLLLRLPQLRGTHVRKTALFWLAALGIVTFLCLRISQPLWDAIPLLQFLQFPAARFHAVALMAACALTVFFIDYRRKIFPPTPVYSMAALLGPVAVMTLLNLHHVYHIYRQPTDIDASYIEHMHALNLIVPQEYWTSWQPSAAGSVERAESNSELPLAFIVKGAGSSSATFADNGGIHIKADIMSQDATLQVRQLYWPAWHSSAVAPQADKDGLMIFQLPHGKHSLTLTLSPLPGEWPGTILSFLAWLGILLFFSVEWTKSKENTY